MVKLLPVIFGRTFAFYEPFRAQSLNPFIDIIGNLAVIANEHCLAADGGGFLAALFVVPYKVIYNHIKAAGASDNLP